MNIQILCKGLLKRLVVIFSLAVFWAAQAAAYDPSANENLIVFDDDGQVTATYHLDDLTNDVQQTGTYEYEVQSEKYSGDPTDPPSVDTETVTVPDGSTAVVPNLLQASVPGPPSGVPEVSLYSFDDAIFAGAAPTKPGVSFSPSSGTYTQTIAVSIVSTPAATTEVVYQIDGNTWVHSGASSIELFVYKNTKITIWATDGADYSIPKTAEYRIIRASGENPEMVDSDHDGIPDSWEIQNGAYGFNPLSSDRDMDTDGDGISDFDEILRGFDPADPCYPKICYAQVEPLLSGSDPLTEADLFWLSLVGRLPGSVDYDQDGWSDWDETELRGTDPDDPDDVPVARRLNEVERILSGTFYDAVPAPVAELTYKVTSFGSTPLVQGKTDSAGAFEEIRVPVGEPSLIRGAGLPIPADPEDPDDPLKNFVSKRYIPVTPDLLPGDVPGEWGSADEWEELYLKFMKSRLVEKDPDFDVRVSDTYPLALLEREMEILAGLYDMEGSPRFLILGSPANIPALTTLINMEQHLTLRGQDMNEHLVEIGALLYDIGEDCSDPLDLSFLTDADAAYAAWDASDPQTVERTVAELFIQSQPLYLAGLLLENTYDEIKALRSQYAFCTIMDPVADLDGDGVINGEEVPTKENPDGRSGIVVADTDLDGINDLADNCPKNANPLQEDLDGDGMGDVCDPDADGDKLSNGFELAFGSNPYLADTNHNGVDDYQEWLAYNSPGISILITQIASPTKMGYQTIGGTIPLGVTSLEVTLNGSSVTPVSFDSAATTWSCEISGVEDGANTLELYAEDTASGDIGYASAGIFREDPEFLLVPDDYATIQAAIDAAEDGDHVLVSPGIYAEDIDFKGKRITVTKTPEPDLAVIRGTGFGPVVTFDTGENSDAVLNGFVITNGNSGQGGGIFCDTGTDPVITNNTIYSNNAYINGGGIFVSTGARPRIISNTIDANTAPAGQGGGIYCADGSKPIIQNNIVSNSSTGAFEILVAAVSYYGDYNNLWNADGLFISGASAGSHTIFFKPLYVPGEYRLSAGSDGIDVGNDGVAYLPPLDQDGKPRSMDGDLDGMNQTDMGAYELGDPCEGDIGGDQDSDVDGRDIFALIQEWGSTCDLAHPCDMDLNHDGHVDAGDLQVFGSDYGRDVCP